MQLALGAPNTQTYVLATLVVAGLALLPGLPLAAGLGRRGGWTVSETLCASFALQVGAVGVVALAAHYAGLPLVFVGWASAALLVAGGAVVWWRAPRTRLVLDRAALAAGGLGLVLGIVERTWYARMADAFYHLAAVRSLLATGRPMVTDPLFRTPLTVLDPTAGVWHTVLACWAGATRLDIAAWIWPGAAGVAAALALLAFHHLARTVSGSTRAATLATLAWLVLALKLDVRWAAYPNRLSLALALIALASVVKLAETPRLADALVAAAAGFGAAAMHMAAAEMLAAAGVLVLAALAASAAVRGRAGAPDWRPAAAVAGAGGVAGALALPLLVPKAALVRACSLIGFKSAELAEGIVRLPGGMLADVPGHLVKNGPVLFLIGAGFGVAASVRALRGGSARDAIVGALGLLPSVLLLFPPVSTPLLRFSYYLTERIAILLPFTVFTGLAWALARPVRDERLRRALPAVAVLAMVVAPLAYALVTASSWSPDYSRSVWRSRKDDVRLIWGAETMRGLADEFAAGYPLVASDTETSYYLAGVLPVAVAGVTSAHTPFAIEAADGPARRTDMEALMAPGTPEARRREILARRGASYVVVPKYRGGFAATLAEMREERELLAPVFESPTLAAFRVRY